LPVLLMRLLLRYSSRYKQGTQIYVPVLSYFDFESRKE
jgi:hypothetical protein